MTLRDRLEKALVKGHASDLDHLLYNERDHIDDLKMLRDAAVLIAVTDRPAGSWPSRHHRHDRQFPVRQRL